MKLLIYGSQDFSRTVADLAKDCDHEVVGFVDDFNESDAIVGTSRSIIRSHPPDCYGVAMAIGYRNLPARLAAWQAMRRAGYTTPSLIHPRAYIGREVDLGMGVMVMAGAIVDVRAKLGDIAVVWPGACLNHDARVGINTFLSPNSTICGHASVGSSCFIGAAAAVVDHGVVPDGSFVQMSARWTRRERDHG